MVTDNLTFNVNYDNIHADILPVFQIKMNAGLFDFSWTGPNRVWFFPDGSTSTDERPAKILSEAGIVELRVNTSDDWQGGYTLNSFDTLNNFIGDLSDFPAINGSITLRNCSNVTGDIYYISHLTKNLELTNCVNIIGDLISLKNITGYIRMSNCVNITGDLSSIENATNDINLGNCSNITGDLSSVENINSTLILENCFDITGDLSSVSNVIVNLRLANCFNITGDLSSLNNITTSINLSNCFNITGAVKVGTTATSIMLENCSNIDVDQTLINIDTTGESDGSIDLTGCGIPTVASSTAITNLLSKGWTLLLDS
jgi:hypothetical protein